MLSTRKKTRVNLIQPISTYTKSQGLSTPVRIMCRNTFDDKFPQMSTCLEDSRPWNLTPGLILCVESNAQGKNTKTLSLNLKRSNRNDYNLTWIVRRLGGGLWDMFRMFLGGLWWDVGDVLGICVGEVSGFIWKWSCGWLGRFWRKSTYIKSTNTQQLQNIEHVTSNLQTNCTHLLQPTVYETPSCKKDDAIHHLSRNQLTPVVVLP